MDYEWRPYVSVAERRAQAMRAAEKLRKKGQTVSPILIKGRTVATTFWGKAWCENLERYSDYANRLPRGRTYVRNGSVIDLQIAPREVRALVSGSAVYQVRVTVAAVSKARWSAICKDSAGAIDSLVELLQGRLSNAVMERLCRQKTGLFPSPNEITLSCSCPDSAAMCKHIAATLYGIGARLDDQPALLFTLCEVDEKQLLAGAGGATALASRRRKGPGKSRVITDPDQDLSALFGLDLAPVSEPALRPEPAATVRKAPRAGRSKPAR